MSLFLCCGIFHTLMNIEFHYYALYYLCRASGFPEDEALKIAISSQMVDENLAAWEIQEENKAELTTITQNYQFWDEHSAKAIYRPFHFIPGDRQKAGLRRRDGIAGKNPVTEDSGTARQILIEALKIQNPYRIGIALHAYADTWAHQNFSADMESQNTIDSRSPLPPVGHLQALKNPDIPRGRWSDPRLVDELCTIYNAQRFSQAAKMIYRFLATSRKKGFEDEIFVIGRLDELWESSPEKADDQARASDYIIEFDVPPYEPEVWALGSGGHIRDGLGRLGGVSSLGYDRISWLKNAARKASSAFGSYRGSIPTSSYRGSRFQAWNEAAKDHLEYCTQVFTQRGIA